MFMNAMSNSPDSGSGLSSPSVSTCTHNDHIDECSICLDRQTEVILPCTHSFCTPCIEQWYFDLSREMYRTRKKINVFFLPYCRNVNNKTCPICCESLESTDETWVMSNIPEVEEINEEICAEFMSLAKDK